MADITISEAQLQTIIHLLNIACKKGVWDLAEAHKVYMFLTTIVPETAEEKEGDKAGPSTKV